jgi:hypothetical protein
MQNHSLLNGSVKSGVWFFVLLLVLLGFEGAGAQEPARVRTGTASPDRTIEKPSGAAATVADPPLKLTFIRRDLSVSDNPRIWYELQNVSLQAIQAYSITESGDEISRNATTYQGAQLLGPGQVVEFEWSSDGAADERQLPVLVIDYVRFADGSDWGSDTDGHRDLVRGHYSGWYVAIKDVRMLIDNNDSLPLQQFIEKGLEKEPVLDRAEQSDQWRAGFVQGYRTLLGQVRFTLEKEQMKGVRLALDDLETTVSGLPH